MDLNRREFLAGTAALAAAALAPAGIAAGSASERNSLVHLTAVELSKAIHQRQVSCVELMAATLDHIERFNPKVNAIVSMPPRELLMREAAGRDAELGKGKSRGWMHGFPHAVKDLADAKGLSTSRGSPIFAANIASEDSIHIARIRDAGAIFIGKTNVPEFGFGSQSYNPVHGVTLNPYDGKSTAGGSSGGAAAALALRMVPVADGSDYMGSLRNPGAFNNVIGLRPTPGLVPLARGFMEELPCNGPMARTVSDTAMLLSTMAGYHKASPSSLKVDPAAFAAPLDRDFKEARIGWLGSFDGYLATEPGVLDVCESALSGFRDLGCRVEAATPNYSMEVLWETWLTFRHWTTYGRMAPLYENPQTRKLLKPELIWEIEGGQILTGKDISDASANRAAWYQAVRVLFERFDFLVLPTAQVFPFDASIHWPKTINGRAMDTYHRWMEVVVPGTLAGCPVINVPAGFSRAGLPMGLQIMAPRYEDFAALQIGHAYESATRWNLDHLPPMLKS